MLLMATSQISDRKLTLENDEIVQLRPQEIHSAHWLLAYVHI
jgi:hypothetical protein